MMRLPSPEQEEAGGVGSRSDGSEDGGWLRRGVRGRIGGGSGGEEDACGGQDAVGGRGRPRAWVREGKA
eukprot:3932228-Rhodomonas_salina.2